jgi:peptidoglycan/LPS O-acetylase OafA/YrhL
MNNPEPKPQPRKPPLRFTELDGLRGLCAGVIVLAHIHPNDWFWAWILMDLFFVMSAFLLTRIVLKQVTSIHGLTAFWARRIERIWPLYMLTVWVLMLLAMALNALHVGPHTELQQFWRFFTFSQNSEWLYDNTLMYPYATFAVHLWSLAIEEQFYIALPIAVLLLRKSSPRLWLPLLLALIPLGTVAKLDNNHMVIITSHIDAFAWGVLLALGQDWLERHRRLTNRLLLGLFVLGLVGFTPYLAHNIPLGLKGQAHIEFQPWPATWGVLMTTSLVAFLAINRGIPALSLFRWRPLIYLGTVSYPLYLVHFPIINLFSKYLPPVLRRIGVSPEIPLLLPALMLITTLTVTHLLYIGLDRHLQAGTLLKPKPPRRDTPPLAQALPL